MGTVGNVGNCIGELWELGELGELEELGNCQELLGTLGLGTVRNLGNFSEPSNTGGNTLSGQTLMLSGQTPTLSGQTFVLAQSEQV